MEKEELTPEASSELKIQILFSGLCAFVGSKDGRGPVDVLLLKAEKSKLKKKLCKHEPVLLFTEFRLIQGRKVTYLQKSDYRNDRGGRLKSIASHKAFETRELYGQRDLDGCSASFKFFDGTGVEVDGYKNGVVWLESMSKVIDLDRMLRSRSDTKVGGVVAKKFNSPEVVKGIIAARLRLEFGELSGMNNYGRKVEFHPENDTTNVEHMPDYMENVVLSLGVPLQARKFVMEIRAKGEVEQILEFSIGRPQDGIPTPSFAISNLCEPDFAESPLVGRDFAAYYDLMVKPVDENQRRLIFTPAISPGVDDTYTPVRSGSGHCAPGSATWSQS